MKSVLRATLIMGGSSLLSSVVGLVATKIYAVLIGAAGIGYIAGLQSFLALSGLIAGLGIGTGIVRFGAKAVFEQDEESFVANRRAAFYIVLVSGVTFALAVIAFRQRVSILLFGNTDESFSVSLIGAALVFSVFSGIFVSLLNAHQKIQLLAKIGILNAFVNSLWLVTFIYLRGTVGIPVGILGGAISICGLNYFLLRRELGVDSSAKITFDRVKQSVADLLRFGIPYTGSIIVGAGVQIAVPLLILSRLGAEQTGLYRAASNISTVSVTLVLAAMGQDYFPRLSAVSENKKEMVKLVNQQQWLSIILLSPIFLWLLLLSPLAIRLLYTAEFYPALSPLKWVVAGDLLKSISWVIAFVVLARAKSRLYFFTETVGGLTSLAAFLVGINWFGLDGAAFGYFLSYLVYTLVVLIIVKREIDFRYEPKVAAAVGLTVLSILTANTLSGLGFDNAHRFFLAPVAVVAGIFAMITLLKESKFRDLINKFGFSRR